ncbi:MAG TPA: alpha-(1-_3)-arabinofuranosyltransferase family protein, partial [Acidimicrobiales bacterium]|nr:alpha-(1->3)-arabinofuranosyltransferase family protein [Acidimicrobiales bacterium]
MSLTTPIKTDPAKRSGTVRRAGAHRSSGRPFDWSHRRRAPELALTVGLLILALLQRPGRIVRDTKLDLAIDPGHFMASVTHLWDPLASFGSVPDQASGYLFPMGSFYWLGASLRVPEWIIQRVWLALLLAAAVWGTILLAEALRIGGRWSRLAGGAAYALSPLVLAQIHDTSYVLPAVLLPWVMLPLVRASQGTLTSPGGAARSGLAVLLMGGTNATATLAVLLLPVIWFATRRPIRAHIRLFGLWVLALVLATAWFVVPLLFQQKYGFNFVPYTETSSVTTQLSYLPELLRGGGDWTSLSNPPIWSTAGFMIEMSPVVIAVSSLLAGLGLWGLARRNLPDRMFLVLATVIATVLVGVGYWGHLGGPFHSTVHTLLDGRLSAFRNVVKFQPVITLAVVLGLIHTLEQFSGALRKLRWPRVDPLMSGLMVATTLIVAVTAAPLFTGKIYPGGSFTAIPSYWYQATNWINDHGAMSNTLVVPGTAFARFNWGNTLDQPFEPLADVPWANRNEVPLSSIGNTQFLDAIDNVLASGQPVPGLADYLARAGVRYLVVENDLNAAESVSPSPVSVRSVLANEAGINRVARFGPTVHQANAGLGAEHVYDPHGQTRGIQSLEVYRVGPTSSGDALVTTYPASSGIRLSGGAQGLLPLAGSGQLDHQAVALTGDPLAPMFPTTTPVVADSQQLRDTALTNLYNQVSYLLAPGQPAPNGGGKPSQWIVVPGTSHETVSVLHGAATVSASSYGPVFEDVPGDQPLSPFLEDSGGASWEAQPNDPRPWIEIRFDHAVPLHAITLTPSAKSSRVTAVQVSTDQGQVTSSLTKGTGPQSVPTAPGSTRFLRVTIVGMEGHRGILSAGPGFAHIGIPGIAVTQSWQVPDDQPATTGITPTYLFSSPLPNQFQLFRNPDEEPSMSRTFTLPTAGTFSIAGLATPRATRALRVAEFPPPGKPAASAADLRAPFAVACGSGPTLMIDGSPYQTSVTGTV